MNDPIKRAKGAKDLVFDAVEETTNLVERMHVLMADKSIRPFTLIEPLSTLTRAVKTVHDTTASGVYDMIRIINKGVNLILDAGTGLVVNGAALAGSKNGTDTEASVTVPAEPGKIPGNEFLIAQSEAIINGFYGDFLGKKKNGLDIGMHFRVQGKILPMERDALARAFPDATGKVCVFVHGLMCTEMSWRISAEKFYGDASVNFGTQFKADLGYTPLFVRYNTGRHISENGQALSELLSQLVDCYPADIEEIMLIGHSMGGLVSRSAAYYGDIDHAAWVGKLKHIVCIGSPNLGAPLEKAVNLLGSLLQAFNTAGTQAPAQILNSRSAGIKDLRFGYTVDDEWMDKNPDALLKDNRMDLKILDHVGYYFIGATVTADPEHPLGLLIGDIMVRVPSAAGHARNPARRIPFRSGYIFTGMNHLHMANHPDVYQVIRDLLDSNRQ